MARADDEEPLRRAAAVPAPSAPPPLDQLVELVEPAPAPTPSPALAPAPAAVPAAATADPRDDALTDLYSAVKPRPKALPLAELDPSSPHRSEEELAALAAARIAAWRARRVAFVELSVLAVLLLTAVWLVRSWRTPVLDEEQAGSLASTRARSRDRAARRSTGRGGPPLLSPRAGVAAGLPVRGDEEPDPTGVAPASAAPVGTPVRIKIEARGDAIVVPVQLGGPQGTLATRLVFDTGATFTTLDAALLRRLGVAPSPISSETETASGRLRRPLAVIESLSVGAAHVGGGMTVGVCEACGGAGTGGLLGLNFSRHFLVTLDAPQGELLLQPRAERPHAALSEIEPFVAFVDTRTERAANKLVISFSVENRSPRLLRDLVVGAELQGAQGASFTGPPQVRIAAVPAGGRVAARIEVPLVSAADQVATLELRRAAW